MTLSLQDFANTDTDYVAKLNNNNTAIENEVNSLAAQILATAGEGAQLILDVFDRDGLIGPQSYRLDLDNYDGGTSITIGRRPAPVGQEVDESLAWGTFSGNKVRVRLEGDHVLNAAAIVGGLPKTIYVGIPANGVPQLFEDTTAGNLIYAYSMTWDGFTLTDLRRRVPILPAYPLLQAIAGQPRMLQVFDPETNWVDDLIGRTEIVLPGASDDNEIDIDGTLEVIGVFVSSHVADDDAFSAPTQGLDPNEVRILLELKSAAVRWNLEDLEMDVGQTPDTIYARIDTVTVGDDRFVKEVTRFRLERTDLGARVVSARGFTWGLIVRPVYGNAIAKDSAQVNQV